jgi:phage-related protein
MVPALSVLGCATSSTTPSQLATDVNLIASGLAAAIASIQQIPGVASTTLTQLQADLTTIQADAAQVASAPATSVVQAIGQAVQAVAALVLPLVPGGSSIEVTVQAALSLLPEIMAAAGVSGATTTPKFTPEQARLILAAAH